MLQIMYHNQKGVVRRDSSTSDWFSIFGGGGPSRLCLESATFLRRASNGSFQMEAIRCVSWS